ncbi:MAG: hypothetical protein NTW54_13600 [Bacteroidetes bacterium]|nr:hypothetical protein [Bacteroidota bacterium]
MKFFLPVLVVLFLFVNLHCGNGSANKDPKDAASQDSIIVPVKKYDLKSSIISYTNVMKTAGMEAKSRQVLYFTDSGKMQCREIFMTNPANGKEVLTASIIAKEGYVFTYSTTTMTGTKTKSSTRFIAGTDMFQDIDKMKQMYKFVELANDTVCGKQCKVTLVTLPSGNAKITTWNEVVLSTSFFDPKTKMSADMKAFKIEENVEVPLSKFEIPADVKFVIR